MEHAEEENYAANLALGGGGSGGNGGELSIEQHMQASKHAAQIAGLEAQLAAAHREIASRKSRAHDAKSKHQSAMDELVRNTSSKLAALQNELRNEQDKVRAAERSKTLANQELESNLSQSIALYTLIQQHQNTITSQTAKCEASDALQAQTSGKLKSAEKEMARLRALLDKEHDANERHISALKGQLSMKGDEVLALTAKHAALSEEYTAHKAELLTRISSLEKDRSLLEAVNFELRAAQEKCHNLEQETKELKATLIQKAMIEGELHAAQTQCANLGKAVDTLQAERTAWVGDRRDLEHANSDLTALLKQMTIERDALAIAIAAAKAENVERTNEMHRRLDSAQAQHDSEKQALQSQLADRNTLITRAQASIDSLQSEIDAFRADKKALLDSKQSLEANVRELEKDGTSAAEQIATAQAQIAALNTQLDSLRSDLAAATSKSESESKLLARTRTSRRALVEKLDQSYSGSYQAQIFSKWRVEWRVREGERALEKTQSELEASQAVVAELQEAREAAQREWENEHRRKLAAAKTDWERDALIKAEEERDERRAREARIAQERERVREEVEEARRIEMDYARAREAARAGADAHSIARRPSIQSLVNHTVQAALRQASPPSRGAPLRRSDDLTDRSHVSRSPSEMPPRGSKAASRRSTLEVPLSHQALQQHQQHSSGQSHSPQHPQQQHPMGFVLDPAIAAAAAAGAEAALLADRARTRSASRDGHRKRHHHHHHHHGSSAHHSRDGSPTSLDQRSKSSSPTMPPLTQAPFVLPPNFAQFVQAMQQVPVHTQQQQLQQTQHFTPVPMHAAAPPAFAGATHSRRTSSGAAAGSSRAGSHSRSASDASGLMKASSSHVIITPAEMRATSKPGSVAVSRTGSAASSAANTGRKSTVSVAASSSTAAARAKVPPLPLHKAQAHAMGLKEAATEVTLAAGSPLDTQSPSPAPATAATAPVATAAVEVEEEQYEQQFEPEPAAAGEAAPEAAAAAAEPAAPAPKAEKALTGSRARMTPQDPEAVAASVLAAKKRIAAKIAAAKK